MTTRDIITWTVALLVLLGQVSAQNVTPTTEEDLAAITTAVQHLDITTPTPTTTTTTERPHTTTTTERPKTTTTERPETTTGPDVIKAQNNNQDLEWACGNSRLTRPGSFESPPDPNKENGYAYNAHCSWLLIAPYGEIVRLEFELFDLEVAYTCVYANVTVHDGTGVATDDLIDRYCGDRLPPVIHSAANHLRVTFKSGFVGFGDGIRANFEFLPMQEIACKQSPAAVLDWDIGGLVSPNYPSSYPSWQNCNWKIQPSQEIRLEFDEWTMSSACKDANITAYEGSSPDPAHLLTTMCGSEAPQPIGTTMNVMYLEFRSNSPGMNKAHFRARYKAHNITEWACGNSKPAELDWSPGYIISPTTDDSLCRWRFSAPVGKVVRLEIEKFDLPSCTNCGCAGLSFYDGENEYAPLIGEYCGNGWDTKFVISGGNSAYLLYKSYQVVPHRGFKIKYSFYDIAEHACGSDRPITLTEGRGLITSPGYGTPTGYPNNADCQWQILAEETQVVRLDFLDFGVEYCPGCQCDRLNVYNGPSLGSNLIRRLCDFARPLPITTTVNSSYLRFTTDRDRTAKGFKIQYRFEVLADLACGISRPATMSTEPGHVYSPDYMDEHGYPPDSYCEWLISAPSGQVVELSFQFMDIEFGYYCEFDYLSVHDGVSTNAPLIKRVCGNTIPKNITSTGDTMMLAFTSNGHLEKLGFKATYSFRSKPTSNLHTLIPAVVCGVLAFLVILITILICCKVPQRIKRRLTGGRPDEVHGEPPPPPPYSANVPPPHGRHHRPPPPHQASNAHISCPPAFGLGREQYTRIAAYPPPTYEESFFDNPHNPNLGPLEHFQLHGINEQPPGYEEGLNTLQRAALRQEVVPQQEVVQTPVAPEPEVQNRANSVLDTSDIEPTVPQSRDRAESDRPQNSVSLAGAGALVTSGMPGYSGDSQRVYSGNSGQERYSRGSSPYNIDRVSGGQRNLLQTDSGSRSGVEGVTNAAYASSQESITQRPRSSPDQGQTLPRSQEQEVERQKARTVEAILRGRTRTDSDRIYIPPDDKSSMRKSLSKSEPDILESLAGKSKPGSSFTYDVDYKDPKLRKGEHSASMSMLHKLGDKDTDFHSRSPPSGARLSLAASNIADSSV